MLRRTLLLQNAAAVVGGALILLAVDVLFVVVLGASPWQMGLLNALSTTAFLICSLPLGQLIDRAHPARVLIWSTAGMAGTFAVLLGLLLVGRLTVTTGLLLMGVVGICAVAQQLSQTALAPRIIDATRERDEPREQGIASLVGRITAVDQSLRIMVPAAAGLLVSVLGAAPVLAGGLVFLAAATAGAGLIRRSLSSGPAAVGPPSRRRSSITEGIRVLWRHRSLRLVTMLVACSNAALAVGSAVEVLFVLEHRALSPAFLGVMLSVGGLGGVLGAVVAPALGRRFAASSLIVVTTLLQIMAAALMPTAAFASEELVPMLLLGHSLLWGMAAVAFNVVCAGWLAALTPVEMMGTVTAARTTLTMGVVPVGSLLGGAVGSWCSVVLAMTLWPALMIVGLASYLILRRTRRTT